MNEKDPFIASFREMQKKMPRFYSRLLAQAGVTLPQYMLLNLIVDTGPVPMSEASSKLFTSKPAITNLVDRLERHQFLKRIPHPKDRRSYLIQILPKGTKVVHETSSAMLDFLLKVLNKFSAAERRTIARFYALITRLIDEQLNLSGAGK